MKPFLLAFTCLLTLPLSHTFAQCRGGQCSIAPFTSSPAIVERKPNYQWITSPAEPRQAYLYRDGVQVGGWDHDLQLFRFYDAALDAWGPPAVNAPIAPPTPPLVQHGALEAWQKDGVAADRLNKRDECYAINGKCVKPHHAYRALNLDDDSTKLWLVTIGSAADRQRVEADLLKPEAADFAKRVRLWSVPPDHFSLLDRDTNQPMFWTGGAPSVYLMNANGDELLKLASYAGPADFEALRKADPANPPAPPAPPAPPVEPKKKDAPAAPEISAATVAKIVGVLVLVAFAGAILVHSSSKGQSP